MDKENRLYRRELKFTIPLEMVNPIIDYISVYCDLDPYSQKSSTGYYQVNSLYMDTKDFGLLSNKKNKVRNRFNLRVRSYGSGEQPPYFFEMKCKIGNMVDKLRSYTKDPDWAQYLTHEKDISSLKTSHSENFFHFYRQACLLHTEPKILTQYDRMAFFSNIDEYARVTFDRNLRYQETFNFNVSPDSSRMCNYDLAQTFGESSSSIVLELKSGQQVPAWMADLIRIFNLNLRSFSKYEKSLEEYFFSEKTELFHSIPNFAFA